MTIDYIEDVLRSLDPATETDVVRLSQEDAIWQSIVRSLTVDKRNRARRYEVVGGLGTAAAVVAVLIASLGGTPVSAVAATLKAAAAADSSAADLPTLASGEYYHQESQVSLTCEISSPNMAPGEAPLTYIAEGTMESWTTETGQGSVVISPSQVNGGGSHFATPNDEARWVALGEPVIPCALVNSSNQFDGNSANSDTGGSLGGYSSTVSGYGGFGLSLAMASRTTLVSATTSINQLPSSPAGISSLLANGELNTDGSTSSTPQVCPVQDGSNVAPTGCTASEELSVLEQLIQLPDASAKLGSVLYQVISDLPGAVDIGAVTTPAGATGTAVEVSQGTNEIFEVVLDPTSGALISCSELLTQDGTTSSLGSVTYGAVQVVDGQGTSASSNT